MVGLAACGNGAPSKPAAVEDSVTIQDLRQVLAARPCDGKTVVALAHELLAEQRPADVLPVAATFEMSCDAPVELDWKVMEAHKRLAQWDAARADADHLIADDPEDSDYWWWRGEVDEQLHQDRAALADYRQSLALSDGSSAGRFAAGHFLEPAERLGRGCEALVALRYFTDELGGELTEDLAEQETGFAGSRACDQLATGHATLESSTTVKVKLGDTTGRFVVDDRAGTSVLSLTFAASAGITMDEVQTDVFAQGLHRGPMATVPGLTIGKASVGALDVIVSEELPDKVDGVIGLDVLMRFAAAGGRS